MKSPAPRAASAAIAALVLLTCPVGADQSLSEVPGRPALPEFDLVDTDGNRHRSEDYLGQPLVVNFWATWCPPCRAEMPALQRAWEQLAKDGISVLGINVGEDAETVRSFIDEQPVELPLLLDPDTQASQRWPMRGLPTTFVVDGAGHLVYQAIGERDWDDPALLQRVRALQANPASD